jgi:hypothetical protein
MKINPRNILVVGVLVLMGLFAISKLRIIFIEAF